MLQHARLSDTGRTNHISEPSSRRLPTPDLFGAPDEWRQLHRWRPELTWAHGLGGPLLFRDQRREAEPFTMNRQDVLRVGRVDLELHAKTGQLVGRGGVLLGTAEQARAA